MRSSKSTSSPPPLLAPGILSDGRLLLGTEGRSGKVGGAGGADGAGGLAASGEKNIFFVMRKKYNKKKKEIPHRYY